MRQNDRWIESTRLTHKCFGKWSKVAIEEKRRREWSFELINESPNHKNEGCEKLERAEGPQRFLIDKNFTHILMIWGEFHALKGSSGQGKATSYF